MSKLSSLSSSELRNLAVVWCYYSGKIEGNTYTYVETETLLKDVITPEKRYEDTRRDTPTSSSVRWWRATPT